MLPCTKEGYQKLKEEVSRLISVERHKIIREIAEARSHGDLKENAEYHSAKEKQGFIEARISHLNNTLANLRVIDISEIQSDKIQFGATVKYKLLKEDKIQKWQIVGSEEADADHKKMSIASPIARNILGKAVGDLVEVVIPRGTIQLKILSIKYN